MSVSGPKVLGALDDALHDIRREEDEILRKLGRSAERIAKIRETEGELLRQFAQGRIEGELAEELYGNILAAQTRAREALKERAGQMSAAAKRQKQLDAELTELVTSRLATLGEIDNQQAELRSLSSRIATTISRHRDYGQQQQSLARLKAVAAGARAKARQADIDREQKGRPYRADPLFTYLIERGYSTPRYTATGLTARLDSWVAKLIGFEAARRNYAMLNDWPGHLHMHAERQTAIAANAENAVDEMERTAIDAAGGGAVRLALDEAQARLVAIDGRVLAVQDARDAGTAAQTLLAKPEDLTVEVAINALVRALGSPDLQSLIGRTRRAEPGPENPLIAQLDDARLRVVEERTDARDQHARLGTLAKRRRALEDIEYEFKALKFDDPRSLFRDDALIGSQLNDFLTGAIDAKTYWAAFRRSQAWSVGTSDWGGGIGLPRHGRQPAAETPREEGFKRPRTATADADG